MPGGSSLAQLLAEYRGHRNNKALPPLTEDQILEWADLHYQRTGNWPIIESGEVQDVPGETWSAISHALRCGVRGLAGGDTLPRLLHRRRGRPYHEIGASISWEQVLTWADDYHERTGQWPMRTSGEIPQAPGETWDIINSALNMGSRGLPRGSSLPRLLEKFRGRRNKKAVPSLTEDQILEWADIHYQRTGKWPIAKVGAVQDAPGETWTAIDSALRAGCRGLAGGNSLARLLAEHRGRRNNQAVPLLTIEMILAWIDEHHARTGKWPNEASGTIALSTGETWRAVATALYSGRRGLPIGYTLAGLLQEHRGIRNTHRLPALTVEQILEWADEHQRRTGEWPKMTSGQLPDDAEETWSGINSALRAGCRGLPGAQSLARLLEEHRGRRNFRALPHLTIETILAWADEHHARTGKWPNRKSGEIEPARGETWNAVTMAMNRGHRGLPVGYTLARLLQDHRGVRNSKHLQALTVEQILEWADEHRGRTGKWPKKRSGPLPDDAEETWSGIDTALMQGYRGLPAGQSLARLLEEHRGAPRRRRGPALSS